MNSGSGWLGKRDMTGRQGDDGGSELGIKTDEYNNGMVRKK